MSKMNVFALAASAATLVACTEREVRYQPIDSEPTEAALVLKSYPVPDGHGQQIKAVLYDVFRGIKENGLVARAELTPDGQLLILGPDGVHDGVSGLLSSMATRKPAPPASVEMSYWLVVSEPAAQTSIGPELKEVTPALNAIAASQGPMRFVKLEKARLRSLIDERGESGSRFVAIDQRASLSDGKIIADVKLRVEDGSRLETRLSLAPGTFVVLGENAVRLDKFKPNAMIGTGPYTMFYVVRAEILHAG